MTMTARQKLVLGISAAVVVIGTVAAVRYNRAYDPVANLTRVHATELPFDAARVRWWHQAATCLGIDTTYDAKLRYFSGDTIPKEWGSEPSRTTIIHGYTSSPDHLILLHPDFVNDSALVIHEQIHDFLKTPGHPQHYFSGRCGVLPGVD
jgi:hypothetical protein